MPKVVADISISLDGFVTGPDQGADALRTWAREPDAVDAEVLDEGADATGVVILGRRLFDLVDAGAGWNDERGYAAETSLLVVTRTPPAEVRLADRTTFIVDGIGSAVSKGVSMSDDRDVVIVGGAHTVRTAVEAGVVDELRLHLAPVLLGGGTPLFSGAAPRTLRQIHVRVSSHATHLTYRLD